MILNTNQMIFEDDTAYELLAEYMTPMPQLLLTEDQAREVLEYFRLKDAEAAWWQIGDVAYAVVSSTPETGLADEAELLKNSLY